MIKYVNVLHALRKSNYLKTQVEIALKLIQNYIQLNSVRY